MPRFTTAYHKFQKRIPEIKELQRLATRSSAMLSTTIDIARVQALCRGSVVLLSSHIEGYIEDLGEVILDRIYQKKLRKSKLGNSFQYYFSKDIIYQIKDTNNPASISVKMKNLLSRDADIWASGLIFNAPLPIDRFMRGFAVPSTDEIKNFFSRFGYSDYQKDLALLLKSNYKICLNMVDQVVDQRNKIAHGDLVVTSTPKDVRDMINLVTIYCRSTDQVVGSWFTKQGCVIR